MKLQRTLRDYLQLHFPVTFQKEPWCTCGNANHVRLVSFRVDGQPATAIVPEGCELTSAQFRRSLPGAQVTPLSEGELDAIYAESELGRTNPFENPFGGTVYMDENLLQFESLVFCPKMFSGLAGECFRVPTHDFQELVRATVVRVFPAFQPVSEA